MAIWVLMGCVKNRNFENPEEICASNLAANVTYAQVKELYVDKTLQIQHDLIIEGYIISSDRSGNFFSVLHFQDSPVDPTEGFQIEIDVRDSHLFYPVGSKVYIKLKGLYLGKSKDVFKIGGVFSSFGNESVGRLPAAVADDHILMSCSENSAIQPTLVSLDNLHEDLTNTLVQFNSVEFSEEDTGEVFAVKTEETERTLVDCYDNRIILLNSGYSDFRSEVLPDGNGTITGVLLRENDNFKLVVRDLEDLDFTEDRCPDLQDEFTSSRIFISELADPDNNPGARFVELYNSDSAPLSLKGWRLNRYTNSNTDISSTVELSGLTIAGESTFVIAPNAEEFEMIYGFPPDIGVGVNSPADSNGDDNLELVDPFGKVIDIFGVVGEDGSGTNHEFEDGRALRNSNITEGKSYYDFSEWTIFNDSGDEGTINQPQVAPDDYTPGIKD
ncbi:DUF5689 domain-containing protein [Maribacter algicola]|uniref:DUF5689 domain-containing protein n=1 Tax=Meishania litoralis TaxID=3434685 RepID=A0ACC7LHZ3_9FLAO